MNIKNYLQTKQSLIYSYLCGCFNSNRLSHALLLYGERGIPLKEIAFFIAQSLVCDNKDPLACTKCNSCLRITHLSYADLIYLSGEEDIIKKDDITSTIADFSKTPIEKKHIMIYIVELVENMSKEATNSLLKFLEEPPNNVYAILTTNNKEKLLPTIISRCETLRFKLDSYENVNKKLSEHSLDENDKYLLPLIYNSVELCLEKIDDKKYLLCKELFLETLENLAKEREHFIFFCENKICENIKQKDEAKMYLDFITYLYLDIIAKKNYSPIRLQIYDKIITDLSKKLPHILESCHEIIVLHSQIDLNISLGLIFEHLGYYLLTEKI